MSHVARILNSPVLTSASRARIERLHERISGFLAPLLEQCPQAEREHAREMLLCSLVLLSTQARLPTSSIEAISLRIVARLLDNAALTDRKRVIDVSEPH